MSNRGFEGHIPKLEPDHRDATIAKLREALADVLIYLPYQDNGVHYCRWCDGGTHNGWKHAPNCYFENERVGREAARERARAALASVQEPKLEPDPRDATIAKLREALEKIDYELTRDDDGPYTDVEFLDEIERIARDALASVQAPKLEPDHRDATIAKLPFTVRQLRASLQASVDGPTSCLIGQTRHGAATE